SIIIYNDDISRGIKRIEHNYTIRGKVTDESGILIVKVNNNEVYTDKNGNFSTDIFLSEEKNKILIEATDIYQNEAFKSVTVTREITNFPINIDSNKRLALVIGNANYVYGGKLSNPVNDARSIESTLRRLNFTVIKYENCNQKAMKKAIDDFGEKLINKNTALFFYAGHGVQVSGNNYLVPIEAKLKNENDVEYDCVRADRILSKMERAGSKTNIVILDACRDNPFERSWQRSARGRGLAFMSAPSGSLIAYATSPGETASDGSGLNGLYTSALLKYIITPNLKIEEIFKKVRETVIRESNNMQIPWESTSLIGNFYFIK
ncbi:caspase family protein, partial [Desulfobacterales bacterium HSG17]|nr:caspase family protein [Desulfobacterales bacterium HSG17]